MHLLQCIECTTPKVNSYVNYGLLMMCQYMFTSFNKCTTLFQDVNNEGG